MIKLCDFQFTHVCKLLDEFGHGGFLALRLDMYLSWWMVGNVHATPAAARDALVAESDDEVLVCVVLDLSTGTAVCTAAPSLAQPSCVPPLLPRADSCLG